MTSQIKQKTKKWKTNLALRIEHLVGEDLLVMLPNAALCDNGLGLCQDLHSQKAMRKLWRMREPLRTDALDLALTVKRIEQDVQYQYQATARLKQSLQNDIQERVKGLEEKLRFVLEHETHVDQTIDRNAHAQCASIEAIIAEQSDVRKLVDGVASRIDQWLDHSQGTSGTAQNELSTQALLEINDLRSKVARTQS